MSAEDSRAVERAIGGTVDLVEYCRDAAVDEWRQRTLLGKALYPIWFAVSAIELFTAICFFGFLATVGWVIQGFERSSNPDREPSANSLIYKDGESDDC